MARRKAIQVICPACGRRAEACLEASGIENYVIDSTTKCERNLRGVYVVGCPGLKWELLRAILSLRSEEDECGERSRRKNASRRGTG
jgi:hypothetical protein